MPRSNPDGSLRPWPAARRVPAIALFIAFSALSATAQSTQAIAPDPSTPKAALKALVLATDHGDSAAIRRLMDAKTPTQARMVDLTSEMAAAIAELNRTMSARFGVESAHEALQITGDPLKQSFSDIDAATEVDNGDTATVSIAATAQGTMTLHRTSGQWKVSMEQSVSQLSPQHLDQDMATLRVQIHIMQDVSAQIGAGKYATAGAAASALHAAMSTAVTPASQPAPH